MVNLKFETPQIEICVKSFLSGFMPPPKRTVWEWADNKRFLTSISSSESGLWRTDRTPYLREIMFELSPLSPAKEIAFQKGSQVGGTEVGLNWLGQTIDEDPCPFLIVQPTIKTGEKFSKQRVAPMIKASPDLLKKMPQTASKTQSNTTLEKEFPGGMMIIAGANSASALRSLPIKRLFLDEIDNYPEDVDGEGDPVELAVARTATFAFSKIFYNSTPNIAEKSRIVQKFEEGDQRIFKVPCPHCGEAQIIAWERIKWRGDTMKEKIESVHLECEGCHAEIPERNKTKMLSLGFWEKQNPEGLYPSFKINALYSPLGWYSWGMAVQDFYKSKGNPDLLKAFINTKLGEAWEEEGNTVEYHKLQERCEPYFEERIVPDPVLILVASADIQKDRIEMEVVGWNAKRENWLLDYKIIMGDPEKPQVWKDLDSHLLQTYTHESGAIMGIAGAFIDAGNWQDHVLNFTKPREDRRIFGSKGRGGAGIPIINRPSRANKQGAALYSVGVDGVKSTIYAALKYDEPGAGYCHFPTGLDKEYFLQLTAEKQTKHYIQGRHFMKWKKIRERNEALDVRVYNIACLEMLNVPWEKLERVGPLTAERLTPKKKINTGRRIIIDKGVEI